MTCKIVPEMTYNVSSGTLSLYTTYLLPSPWLSLTTLRRELQTFLYKSNFSEWSPVVEWWVCETVSVVLVS